MCVCATSAYTTYTQKYTHNAKKINVFFSENHDFEKIKGAECCAFNYLLGSSVIVSG